VNPLALHPVFVDTNILAYAQDARFLQEQAITRIDAPLAQFSYHYDPFGRRIAKSVTKVVLPQPPTSSMENRD
jgi:hypothetical protein